MWKNIAWNLQTQEKNGKTICKRTTKRHQILEIRGIKIWPECWRMIQKSGFKFGKNMKSGMNIDMPLLDLTNAEKDDYSNNRALQTRPTIWIWKQLPWRLVIAHPNSDFLNLRIVQSWFASIPSCQSLLMRVAMHLVHRCELSRHTSWMSRRTGPCPCSESDGGCLVDLKADPKHRFDYI